MTSQAIGTLTYDRPLSSATTSTTLETNYVVTNPSANVVRVTEYLTLDPDAVAQVSTVTITAGSAGDDYVVTLLSNSVTRKYRHKMESGETATDIASFLATLIDSNPDVRATSSLGVITISAAYPGRAFTLGNTGSTTGGNVVVATTTANVAATGGGTLYGKVGEFDFTFTKIARTTGGITATYPRVEMSGTWYDGDTASPASTGTISAIGATSPTTIDSMQTDAGVPRPAA